jgi:hypothetical protein
MDCPSLRLLDTTKKSQRYDKINDIIMVTLLTKKNGMNMQQKQNKKKKKLGDTTIEHITINSALLFDPH